MTHVTRHPGSAIKTSMGRRCPPVRTAKIRKRPDTGDAADVEWQEPSSTAGGTAKRGGCFAGRHWFLTEQNPLLAEGPAGGPQDGSIPVQLELCTRM